MPIFSRRSLQRMIHANVPVIGEDACARHAKLIDDHRIHSISAEWEVAVIHALSQLGAVAHELGDTAERRVDLCFRHNGASAPLFSADIVAVSDKGIEEENPVQALHRLLDQVARKAHLSPSRFGLWIEGGPWGPVGKQKMRAFVPRGADQTRLARVYLEGFASLVTRDNEISRSARIQFDDVNFIVGYNPQSQGRSSGGPNLTVTVSPTRNPLFRALKAKAKQIKAARTWGLRGIVVCDAGSDCVGTLERGQSRKKIIDEFLRVHSSINFVVFFLVVQTDQSRMRYTRAVRSVVYARESLAGDQRERLLAIWTNAAEKMPPPVDDPSSALSLCHSHRFAELRALTHYGGWIVTPKTIRVSAREVLRLLAGEITTEEFRERNRLYLDKDHPIESNPFRFALKRGRTIVGAAVDREPDFDDDWLEFEFSEPDPAAASLSTKQPSAAR